MDIVILANFCMDFSDTDNGRFHYIASNLSSNNEVELITSDFYHISKQHRKNTPETPYKLTLLHEPGYPKNISLKRFYSHFVWGLNVIRYLYCRKKPDVIYTALPSLFGPYIVSKYCKKAGIRHIIDIQDLWPEAFKMVFNPLIVSSIIYKPFYMLANYSYKKADGICGVSRTYVDRAMKVNKRSIPSAVVYLGTNLNTFDKYSKIQPHLTKDPKEVWIGYCGTLGSSYDLKCIFDALCILHNNNIKLVIMGDGPKEQEFKDYVKDLDINVHFCGRLPYSEMCSILSRCDFAVNPISHGAAQSIINKHADYAAAGLPVINTQESNEYCQLIKEYDMGINCENGNSLEVAQSIMKLLNNESLRKQMSINARKCAEDRFDRKTTYTSIFRLIGGDIDA